ncbi:hypothetical protein BD310DRAFT_824403, partial [Dichomitus squalens]
VALLYYNFATTVDLEVERYWSGSRSWASVFFFINRYTAVLAHIPVVYEFFGLMPESWTITSVHLSQEPVPQDMIAQPGCDLTVSINQSANSTIFLAVAWGVMLVLDATVFTITFFQAIHMDRLWSHSLAHRMLIDGEFPCRRQYQLSLIRL